ncbi:LysR family transcriptional regulator [Tropicibacter alexandrii]|uniref:LysR family transcriptional regulator n=1 Tax=Tropicibacter alexandrii TaxID=2267683 RepID=UPI000EF52FF4|nr:LysR substrate-binding domain-containing protein [Tropicibacter alexandrii]
MRVIHGLAELKLVARVAAALNVTQPAVSKQINELEAIIGTPIIARKRNRLHLTPVGERLAEHARQVLNQLDRASFDIQAMASGVSGAVTVGVVSSVAPILLPGAISLFKRSAPDASLSVTEGHFVSLYPRLEAGQIDLLIARVWQPQDLPGIEQAVMFSEPLVVVAGRDHALARQEDVRWPEAVRWPWVLPQPDSVARRAVDALFAEYGLTTPSNTISSLSLSLNLELLREMPVLALFPQSLAQAYAARGDLVVLPLDTAGFLSEARCFWKSGAELSNSTFALFMDCLRQTANQANTIPFG